MIVALTGATGFIGRHVLAALAATDADIAVLLRPGRPPLDLPARARAVVGDDSSLATPPSSQRLIPRTPIPSSRATRAWPISCTSSDTKNKNAPRTPKAQ